MFRSEETTEWLDEKLKSPRLASSLDRSSLVIPAMLEVYASKFEERTKAGLFFGGQPSNLPSVNRGQLERTRSMAKLIFNNHDARDDVNQEALERTKTAARCFFSLANALLADTQQSYPLAGRNKCLGMVAVPKSKLVLIAISEDKLPANDIPLRKAMVSFINEINQKTSEWIFELVRTPTAGEYFLLRTLSLRVPHTAPKDSVEPHTRCIEVALMVALCKVGRFKKFTPDETGVLAMGATPWAAQMGNDPVPLFKNENSLFSRNTKYVHQEPIKVPLEETSVGWVDIWEPCEGHCQIYRNAMLAMGAAGGPATSFVEPRGECDLSEMGRNYPINS